MKKETKKTIKRVAWKTIEIVLEAGLVVSAAVIGAEVAGTKVLNYLSETISELKEEA